MKKVSKYFNLKSQKIQGGIITILVIIEILIVCKIFFLNYSDLFTRNGIFLVVLGFLITVLKKNDKVKLGQTIIEGGLFIMILSCFI